MRAVSSLLLVACVFTNACSGSSANQEVTAPVPTAAPNGSSSSTTDAAETTSPTTLTTEAPTTTAPPETTVSTVAGSGDRYLPADLGTVVDSAPGVDSAGQITELIDNVWFFVPSEPADDDANVVPPLPEDRDILIAYAEAQAAYHEQASMNPVPTEPSARLAASIADGGQRLIDNVLAPAAANGEHLDLTDGIVLRPVVIADPRSETEAFIFDCQLDGTVFVNADGSLADGQVPGVTKFPQIASVIKVNGEWIVDRLTRDERACA